MPNFWERIGLPPPRRVDETPVRRRTDTSDGPEPSPGTPSGGESNEGQFRPALTWVGALIDSGLVPVKFDGRRVIPILDALQGGWGVARIIQIQIVSPVAAAASFVSLLRQRANLAGYAFLTSAPIDLTATFRVMGFHVVHNAGAAAAVNINLSASRATDVNTLLNRIARTFIANGAVVAEMFGVPSLTGADPVGFGIAFPIWLPPPMDLVIELPATAGGEAYIINAIVAQLPGGVQATG